jgi:putrescine transport system permease protein
MNDGRRLPRSAIVAPFAWLVLLLLVPLLLILKISLAEPAIGQPPYTPLFDLGADGTRWSGNLANYRLLATDTLYLEALWYSVGIAALSTLLCLLLGYPMAYAIARASDRWRPLLLMLVILPFWTSFLIRIYALIGLLNDQGAINTALRALGLLDEPLRLLHTPLATVVGIVYAYLPLMVLPLYANLAHLDRDLQEAAGDLGARPAAAFFTVTLPLSIPGIVAGCLLVFIPAVGEFVIPDLLGGPGSLMIGKLLWTEFFTNRDWPLASALALLLLVLLVAPILWFERQRERKANE